MFLPRDAMHNKRGTRCRLVSVRPSVRPSHSYTVSNSCRYRQLYSRSNTHNYSFCRLFKRNTLSGIVKYNKGVKKFAFFFD